MTKLVFQMLPVAFSYSWKQSFQGFSLLNFLNEIEGWRREGFAGAHCAYSREYWDF